jgi:hypothetical protein
MIHYFVGSPQLLEAAGFQVAHALTKFPYVVELMAYEYHRTPFFPRRFPHPLQAALLELYIAHGQHFIYEQNGAT